MKNLSYLIILLSLSLLQLNAQSSNEKRIAYSYLSSIFEEAIIEHLDKSKLSSKEDKLYKKFKAKLENQALDLLEQEISAKLRNLTYTVQPLDAVGVMGNSALNLERKPFILFPKKTLKKNTDKDVADEFISASMSISKPLLAVAGMKPEVTVNLKHFNKMGELVNKSTSVMKTDKKVSNIGFAVNQSESFSKIDIEHADILFSKVEETIKMAIDDAFAQLLLENEITEK